MTSVLHRHVYDTSVNLEALVLTVELFLLFCFFLTLMVMVVVVVLLLFPQHLLLTTELQNLPVRVRVLG